MSKLDNYNILYKFGYCIITSNALVGILRKFEKLQLIHLSRMLEDSLKFIQYTNKMKTILYKSTARTAWNERLS